MPEVGLVGIGACAGGHAGKAGPHRTLVAFTGIELDRVRPHALVDLARAGRQEPVRRLQTCTGSARWTRCGASVDTQCSRNVMAASRCAPRASG